MVPEPKIVLKDAVNNTIDIVENDKYCLVYDRPLAENGLTWRELVAWWTSEHDPTAESELVAGRNLDDRLRSSTGDNEAEQFLFSEYCKRYGTAGFDETALIPQIHLHYDPYTRRIGATLQRQRMDFLDAATSTPVERVGDRRHPALRPRRRTCRHPAICRNGRCRQRIATRRIRGLPVRWSGSSWTARSATTMLGDFFNELL